MKALIKFEIRNPTRPKTTIPIAETFATVVYSFLVGFFRACQTRLHLTRNCFVEVNILFAIVLERVRGVFKILELEGQTVSFNNDMF